MWRKPRGDLGEAWERLASLSGAAGRASVSLGRPGTDRGAAGGAGGVGSLTFLSMVARPFRVITTSMLPAAVAAGTTIKSSAADTLTVVCDPL